MRYAATRSKIKTGDLIAVHYSGGWFWWLVKKICRSDIVHVGLAVWLDGGLFVAEMQSGGNVLRPLSQQRSRFSVYRLDINSDRIASLIMLSLRQHINYGYLNLIGLALRKLLNLNIGYTRSAMTCGTFCLRFFRKFDTGIIWQHSNHITPVDLVKNLNYQFTIEQRPEVLL